MRQIALPLLMLLAALSASAQAQDAAPEGDEPPGLMERGADMFLRGLLGEVEPGLREMERALRLMEPELRALLAQVDDLRNYQAPERLPNGDILIRRRPDAPPLPEAAPEVPPGTGPEVEL